MDYGQCPFDPPGQVRALAEELEELFGRAIPIGKALPKHPSQNAKGTFKLDVNDTHIYLRDDAEPYDLAHELCHMKRYASGIPLANAGGGPWDSRIENPLEHYAIYPVLDGLQLGVDPRNTGDEWQWFDKELRSLLDNSSGLPRSMWTWNLACDLWHTLLLKNDERLQQEVAGEITKVNQKAAEMGRRIAGLVASEGVRTAGKKATALRKVKRILGVPGTFRLLQVEVGRATQTEWFSYRPYGEI